MKSLFEMDGFNSDTRFAVKMDFFKFKKGDVIRLFHDNRLTVPVFICDETGERSICDYRMEISRGFIRVLPATDTAPEQKQSQDHEREIDHKPEKVKQTPFEMDGFNNYTRFYVMKDFRDHFKKGDVIRLFDDDGSTIPYFTCDKTGKMAYLSFRPMIEFGFILVLPATDTVPEPKQTPQIPTNNNTFWYIGNGQVTFEEPAKKRMVADEPIPESPDFTSKKHLWDF